MRKKRARLEAIGAARPWPRRWDATRSIAARRVPCRAARAHEALGVADSYASAAARRISRPARPAKARSSCSARPRRTNHRRFRSPCPAPSGSAACSSATTATPRSRAAVPAKSSSKRSSPTRSRAGSPNSTSASARRATRTKRARSSSRCSTAPSPSRCGPARRRAFLAARAPSGVVKRSPRLKALHARLRRLRGRFGD